MALCGMQPQHRVLALRSAMALHYKQKNFIYSSYFAKKLIRIIETTPSLGIFIDSLLIFSTIILTITSKSKRTLGSVFLIRN